MSPFVGTFFSKKYVLKKVLRLDDNEIAEMEQDIQSEPVSQSDTSTTNNQ